MRWPTRSGRTCSDNVAKLKSAAPILGAAVEQNKLKVVGGIYRLTTGKVDMVGWGALRRTKKRVGGYPDT